MPDLHLLIDINVPDRFSLWQAEASCEAVAHLNRLWPDEVIWRYARQRNQVVVTHDTDYRQLALSHEPPPRVILLRTGNLKMRQFHTFLHERWPAIKQLLVGSRLVEVSVHQLASIPL